MNKITIFPRFPMGSIVFLKVKSDREAGMVTGILVRPDESLLYYVTWENGYDEDSHYEIELTDTYEKQYDAET
jgi:hypothetical protein